MRVATESEIANFSNQTFSFGSMIKLMGTKPHHIGGYIRHKKQYSLGLLAITEMLGNVFMDEKGLTKLEGIDTYSFTYDVETSQIPVIRFTRDHDTVPSDTSAFHIFMESRYFSKYDVIRLRNTQLLYVLQEAERESENEFRYLVQHVSEGAPDYRFMKQYEYATYAYNNHPEFSEYGTTKYHYNMERHINYMAKLRAGQRYSSDFRAAQDLFFIDDANLAKAGNKKAGQYKIFKLNSIEQHVLDHFLISANQYLLTGRSTVNEATGRSRIQVGHDQDVIAGDGLIPQYERYAYYIDYPKNKLSLRDMQEAVDYVADKRGKSQGNHITVICNRRFSRHKNDALQNAINVFSQYNNGTWFFSRDVDDVYNAKDEYTPNNKVKRMRFPQETVVGSTFNTYVYDGNTVTFVVDEVLTTMYPYQGYGIFIDTGIYEDENGKTPGVHLKTIKGRALIKNYINGMGGVDGRSDGNVSTPLDASRFEVLGFRGICVRNPYAATIIKEIV